MNIETPDHPEPSHVADTRSPEQRYTDALASGAFMPDEEQGAAIQALNEVWQKLIQRFENSKKPFRRLRPADAPHGVYMWGGVGRGKTWLMDQFFDAIPFRRKMRMHFHHFMQRVHHELNSLTGQRNPLDTVADRIYADAVVICFDEFFVSNVTDAMILSDLFQKLFERGITLVATSNIAPDGLYRNGIHRDRFLPTIAMIKARCTVLNVDAGIDYRLRVLKQAHLYLSPLTHDSENWLAKRFAALTQHETYSEEPILVNERLVETRGHTEDTLWCDFAELCMKPRSPADYIELANTYNTILLGKVPALNDNIADATRRLIYLVDEFYDRRVKLIITAQQPILALYQGEKLAFEIERTRSRLLEMQSDDYLKQEHQRD
ncbi:cell division protein ZapE [Alkanindiges sp. WGS2144]|uniref:cell division protein ZapE n=1 Tax=Alkanindiges sp. WGS2144 TaxID=3366808 RepID=UPI00375200B5